MNPGYYQADRTATASKKRRILCFIDCLALRIKCSAAVFSAAPFVRTLNDGDAHNPKPQEHTIRSKRQEEIQAERDRRLESAAAITEESPPAPRVTDEAGGAWILTAGGLKQVMGFDPVEEGERLAILLRLKTLDSRPRTE